MNKKVFDSSLPIKPLFSAVIAVYNVEPYLPSFLGSLSQQTSKTSDMEYIFINDGSDDGSLDTILAWATQHENVVVINSDQNFGVSHSRNLGYALARGLWVTSVDPDDVLDCNYFTAAKNFVENAGSSCDLFTTRIVGYNERLGIAQFNHPLDYRFQKGNQIFDITEEPRAIQLGANTFLKTDFIRQQNLTFDQRVKPTFEDAHLIARYILNIQKECPEHQIKVGFVSAALYYYRHRSAENSLVSSAWTSEKKYDDEIVYGYFSLIKLAIKINGALPQWLENIFIYQLSWQFIEGVKPRGANSWIMTKPELRDKFLTHIETVFTSISANALRNFSIKELPLELRATLFAKYFPQSQAYGFTKDGINQLVFSLSMDSVVIQKVVNSLPDVSGRIVKIFGVPFARVLSSRKHSLDQLASKCRVSYEKIEDPIDNKHQMRTPPNFSTNLISRLSGSVGGLKGLQSAAKLNSRLFSLPRDKRIPSPLLPLIHKVFEKFPTLLRRFTLKLAVHSIDKFDKFTNYREKYAHAWLIMDRMSGSNDNAEHFYRYLSQSKDLVNAYFLLAKTAPDYPRLRKEGFRFLPHNVFDVIAALKYAEVIIASDWAADDLAYIWNLRGSYSNKPLVFLQHGITKDDISQWLNGLNLSLIITSLPEEYHYLTDSESPYHFTKNQVVLTGMPRYDRLRELAMREHSIKNSVAKQTHPLQITIMPTWRNTLRDKIREAPEADRSLVFKSSQYYKKWNVFLNHLSSLANQNPDFYRLNFVTHPNVAEFLSEFESADYLSCYDMRNIDFQQLLARTDLFITDYSSTAFDAAIAGANIAYYQFDRDDFFGSQQNMLPGWFDYEKNGYGPVLSSANSVIEWIEHERLKDESTQKNDVYYQRRQKMITSIPSDSCQKIYEEITKRFS